MGFYLRVIGKFAFIHAPNTYCLNSNPHQPPTSISPNRLVAFSDGIFAIAITLLAYACRGQRLIEKDTPQAVVRLYLLRGVVSQVFFGLSILLAFFRLGWAEYFLFSLIPAQLLLSLCLNRRKN
jgi:hypothetical protein